MALIGNGVIEGTTTKINLLIQVISNKVHNKIDQGNGQLFFFYGITISLLLNLFSDQMNIAFNKAPLFQSASQIVVPILLILLILNAHRRFENLYISPAKSLLEDLEKLVNCQEELINIKKELKKVKT